ncbi:MAG: sigma-70 family RNA polymerase sigma factor [Polyangiaceae bacterium]
MEQGDGSRFLELARAKWPGIGIDVSVLEQRWSTLDPTISRELNVEQICEIVLAWACAEGDLVALRVVERTYISNIASILSKVEKDPVVIDEVVQRVRVRVLVGEGEHLPRIAEYSGRGSLVSWFRVVALRAHTTLMREQGRVRAKEHAADDNEPMPAALTEISPEMHLARQRYGKLFEESLKESLKALEPKERILLRLVYVDGVSLDRLGASYGVHKSTISRWVSAARDKVLESTLRHVGENLSIENQHELESVLRFVKSVLDPSLSSVFEIA